MMKALEPRHFFEIALVSIQSCEKDRQTDVAERFSASDMLVSAVFLASTFGTAPCVQGS